MLIICLTKGISYRYEGTLSTPINGVIDINFLGTLLSSQVAGAHQINSLEFSMRPFVITLLAGHFTLDWAPRVLTSDLNAR